MGFENADFRIEVMDTTNHLDVKLVTEFLASLDFDYSPDQVEYTMVLYNLNNQILGTGSSLNGVLKFVAVAARFRETSAFAQIVTHLNDQVLSSGYKTVFVFTKPENSIKFQGLGFKEIALVKPFYAFLEFGYTTIKDYKSYLESQRRSTDSDKIAAVIVNCNPFTRGHQFLIEKASAENEVVYVLVVEEDRSAFPFDQRLELIRRGTAHLDNVVILKGSKYVVSGATFPMYFLKNESIDEIARNQTELDVTVFANHIAPCLGIKRRYVGTEVYCNTTAAYNDAMKKVLPGAGIELVEVERKTMNGDDNFISASKVRAAIKEGRLESVKNVLPPTTYEFLVSPEAAGIIAQIKSQEGRH